MARLTDTQIQEARSKDFKEFLEREGFSFRKHGNSYECVEHDSLVLNKKGDCLWYHWYSRDEKGNIITFVQNNITNGNFRQAVAYILNCNIGSYSIEESYSNENKKNSLGSNFKIDIGSDMKRLFAYLTTTRGIDKDLVNQLIKQDKIAQDSKNNIVFKYMDESGRNVGGELKGTCSSKSFSGVAKNSDENYGFTIVIGNNNNIKEIKVFEASSDLLSYYQLFGNGLKNTILLSLGGCTKIKKISTYLRQYENLSLISACVDNDKAGNTSFDNISKEYSNYEIHDERELLLNNGVKDYNELLKKGIIK
ncbi:DUF3991 and TOPRIM domain-containing protein [Clostridium saccharobutylicum]|uniref:LtrC-like protein n=1 Tax=Clostridium saccharobutylicum DSM 13864 TaxID=1345695 RepID=U5MWC8_CLOSA|nr:DUF3991 and TOPRIM domain-containing protein [Clostridium saccharobutylicum]AGX43916.1 LtrC-like protein [Clostridium saccharobutylicum DSM 13864]AQR91213.1 hypothetical protein CLOSC_29370 [Clostridium saccharobutylicum]AQS01117.1 hypothetical protein CSACC_29440 [Clostridium saccharobutylicum]AQS15100.1 hypothetical protein CLOSACC_29440 [Clostridium saccharobutylicum]MBA2905226.1 hypothetical protein [Clostridium saccharobutylicum]